MSLPWEVYMSQDKYSIWHSSELDTKWQRHSVADSLQFWANQKYPTSSWFDNLKFSKLIHNWNRKSPTPWIQTYLKLEKKNPNLSLAWKSRCFARISQIFRAAGKAESLAWALPMSPASPPPMPFSMGAPSGALRAWGSPASWPSPVAMLSSTPWMPSVTACSLDIWLSIAFCRWRHKRKHLEDVKRKSLESQKGTITIQRCFHENQGGISSSVLSVFFTDNKLLKSLHLIGWEQICQWKTLTKRLMKCPPEGHYHCWLCTAIATSWFSAEHLWILIAPFWLSADNSELFSIQFYVIRLITTLNLLVNMKLGKWLI